MIDTTWTRADQCDCMFRMTDLVTVIFVVGARYLAGGRPRGSVRSILCESRPIFRPTLRAHVSLARTLSETCFCRALIRVRPILRDL